MSDQVERRWVALICKRCGGISDGPVDTQDGTCECPDEAPGLLYEPVAVMPVSDHRSVVERLEAKSERQAQNIAPLFRRARRAETLIHKAIEEFERRAEFQREEAARKDMIQPYRERCAARSATLEEIASFLRDQFSSPPEQ